MNMDVMGVQEVSPGYELVAENPAVPVGYKHSASGLIPEEWETLELEQALTLQRGYDLPHRLRKVGNVPIISSSGVSGSHVVGKVAPPGVVTGRYGTIGEVFYVSQEYWPLNTTLYVKDFKENDPRFIYYLLKKVDFVSHSGKSGVPGVNRNDVHKEQIALPPVHEQRAIATALSDVDALLEELDRLIAKKRDIKQAAMQELLTGESRLPGFEGEWDELQLGDVIDRFIGGGTPSRGNASYWNGTIPWVTVKDFVTFNPYQAQENITLEGLKNSASNLIPSGTLITSTRMALGKAVIYKVDVAINQDLKALALSSKISPDFLCYWFGYNANVIDQLGGGSTVKGISINQIKLIPIQLPSVDEQLAIVKVLDDMDTEIQALEQRRIKTAELKQGMMQELLTGRTRLV